MFFVEERGRGFCRSGWRSCRISVGWTYVAVQGVLTWKRGGEIRSSIRWTLRYIRCCSYMENSEWVGSQNSLWYCGSSTGMERYRVVCNRWIQAGRLPLWGEFRWLRREWLWKFREIEPIFGEVVGDRPLSEALVVCGTACRMAWASEREYDGLLASKPLLQVVSWWNVVEAAN